MNKKILGLLIGLGVFLVAMPAFAATATTAVVGTAMGRVLDFAFQLLLALGVPFAYWIIHRITGAVETKLGFTIPAPLTEELDSLLGKGIAYAEQKAAVVVKAGGDKLKGPAKLEIAANFVLDLAEQYKLPEMAKDKVEKLLESKLGLTLPTIPALVAPTAPTP